MCSFDHNSSLTSAMPEKERKSKHDYLLRPIEVHVREKICKRLVYEMRRDQSKSKYG